MLNFHFNEPIYETDLALEHTLPLLSDLIYRKLGWRRWLHGMPDLSFLSLGRIWLRLPFWRGRIFRLAINRTAEIISSAILDTIIKVFDRRNPILFQKPGDAYRPNARSVALYVHYSSSGAVSEMVRRQLNAYRDLGFAVVFISNAAKISEETLKDMGRFASLVIHRRNFGYDFGAWKNVYPLALLHWPDATEILMVNDSCLGPFRPLDPAVTAMRRAGDGIFGMQESLQGGTHLQSWFVLCRGKSAVADVGNFLKKMRLSTSKWKTIQRGELRLVKTMLARGHRVRAVHSYQMLVDSAMDDADQSADLAAMLLGDKSQTETLKAHISNKPLNPTHHLWRTLAKSPYCSFIKTELVHKNPGNVPNVQSLWQTAVPENVCCPLDILKSHLAEFRNTGGAPDRRHSGKHHA